MHKELFLRGKGKSEIINTINKTRDDRLDEKILPKKIVVLKKQFGHLFEDIDALQPVEERKR